MKVPAIRVLLLGILLSCTLFAQDETTYRNIEHKWFEGNLPGVISLLENSTDLIDVFNLIYTEMLVGNYDKALRLNKKLETKEPEWYLYLKGHIYYFKGDLNSALPLLSEYYDEYPGDFEILMTISELYYKQKRYVESREILIERVDDFDNEILMDGIARSYLAENKLDEALLWLIEAEKIYPSLDVLWHFIQIYDKTNSKKKLSEYGLKISNMYSGNQYLDEIKDIFEKHGIGSQLILPQIEIIDPIILNVGEILKYEISYGWIHLGEMSIVVKDELEYRGNQCYLVEYKVDTAAGLPFITMHHRYLAYLDKKSMLGYKSMTYTEASDGFNRKSYIMDYKNKKLEIYRIREDGRISFAQKALPDVAVDAMSLLFYARNLIKNKLSTTVTTIIDDNFKTADIYFQNQQENIEILNQTVNSEEVFAQANFEGIAGMTGEVWGWFVDTDVSCVPAIGKAQIFLGKVTLTLVKWRP